MNKLKLGLVFILLFSAFAGFSQQKPKSSSAPSAPSAPKSANVRLSPPKIFDTLIGQTSIHMEYGSPCVRGREVWGRLVPYDELWRAGANEATIFHCTNDIKIGGEILPKGKYSLFMIPGKTEWVVVFNKQTNLWGTYGYSTEADALRVKVSPELMVNHTEELTFGAINDGIGLFWEKLLVPITINN